MFSKSLIEQKVLSLDLEKEIESHSSELFMAMSSRQAVLKTVKHAWKVCSGEGDQQWDGR